MKISILFRFQDKPSGGGNQFLRSLKPFFEEKGCYTTDPDTADAVLYNSHQNVREVAAFKCKHPDCICVQRIDGPMRLYNQPGDRRDFVAYAAMAHIADCTIFQSEWSKQKNEALGIPKTTYCTTIMNAPDPALFKRAEGPAGNRDSKIQLIASSWSANWGKGFDVYQWMDRHLDFSKYAMTFVGNSPITFDNIRHLPPLHSHDLAAELQKYHIYIAASRMEACSNSVLEALHCGLPVIAPNRSSNPGIVGKGGELFDQVEEIPILLDRIARDHNEYKNKIDVPTMGIVGQSYYDTIYAIYNALQNGEYVPKRLKWWGYIRVLVSYWLWKLHERVSGVKNYFAARI